MIFKDSHWGASVPLGHWCRCHGRLVAIFQRLEGLEDDRNIPGPSNLSTKYLEKWWKLRSPTNGVDDVDFLKQSFTEFYGSLEGLGPGGPGMVKLD